MSRIPRPRSRLDIVRAVHAVDDLTRLTYLDGLVEETMRLHPPSVGRRGVWT